LSLALTGGPNTNDLTLISRHSHQLQKLQLQVPIATRFVNVYRGEEIFPNLNQLSITGSFPGSSCSDLIEDFIPIFHSAPNLTQCTFRGRFNHGPGPAADDQVAHPHLQRLIIGGEESSAVVLDFFTLPALTDLEVSSSDTRAHLLPCLTRSSPDLQRLTLRLDLALFRDFWPLSAVKDCFRHHHLTVQGIHQQLTPFLTALANFSLPNFIEFTVVVMAHPDEAWIGQLVDVVSTRRMGSRANVKLQCFRFHCVFNCITMPERDQILLQAFASDGLDIYLGTERWLAPECTVVAHRSDQPRSKQEISVS
jgi:hypothetical protein